MNIKTVSLVSSLLLIASLATAQVLCGPTPSPSPTLFVNWPQLQFDAAHSGCNPYEYILGPNTVKNLRVKWQAQKVQYGDYTSPVVVDGVLYASLYTTHYTILPSVVAVDASTGAGIWTYAGPQLYFFSSPAVARGIVYFGSSGNDADNGLYALNAKTGVLIWKYATGNGREGTPAVADGVVYFGSSDHNVYALDAATGALIWKYATGDSVLSLPAVANGVVYVGSDDSNLYALDARTGAMLWKSTFPYRVEATPSVVNGIVYLGNDQLYALNANTGALIWSYPVGTDSPAVANGVVCFSVGYDSVYALNANTGALIWRWQLPVVEITPATVANGVVYVGAGGTVIALDASTGAIVWQYVGEPEPFSSPTIANGVLYVSTAPIPPWQYDSQLYAFSLSGH
jgi:outer membrane protein assembly factor BamB